jgi:hypothetical protein
MIAIKQKLHSVGMCISVETDTIFLSLQRVRDASLQDAGKEQTASFSTERCIPDGMLFRKISETFEKRLQIICFLSLSMSPNLVYIITEFIYIEN